MNKANCISLCRNTPATALRGRCATRPLQDLRYRGKPPRRAATLLLCLFVMSFTALALLGMLNTATFRLAAHRNTVEYERALYLAGAGVHHALAEIEADPNYTTDIPATPPASADYYSATITPGSGNEVVIVGTGVSGSVTRTVEVTIE